MIYFPDLRHMFTNEYLRVFITISFLYINKWIFIYVHETFHHQLIGSVQRVCHRFLRWINNLVEYCAINNNNLYILHCCIQWQITILFKPYFTHCRAGLPRIDFEKLHSQMLVSKKNWFLAYLTEFFFSIQENCSYSMFVQFFTAVIKCKCMGNEPPSVTNTRNTRMVK